MCSVSAVEEVISTRRAYMLASFLKASLWVTGIALIFTEVFSIKPVQIEGWEFSTNTMVWGLVFGAGAALNGGCAVSTLTRLGSGNVGKILTLVGFLSGAIIIALLKSKGWVSTPNSTQTILGQDHNWKIWLAGGVALWMCWEAIRLIRSRFR
ncbi:MAG: YeeE/YedE thiosulfate transporter family protein, partial [Sneathiella sp.]